MTNNDTHIKEIEDKLQDLLEEAKKINVTLSETKKMTTENFDAIESEVDVLIKDIDSVCLELEKEENLAAEEIDKLILEQAEEAAKE